MKSKPVVAVILGGQSSEHSISCLSGASVLSAIDRSRYDVRAIGITRGGAWVLASNDPNDYAQQLPEIDPALPGITIELTHPTRFVVNREPFTVDVIFPVLHGAYGEDGTIQGMLEMLAIPYVGSGVLASAAAMDKVVMKSLFDAAGLPSVSWREVSSQSPDQLASELGLPLFLKPARAGSSQGIVKCGSIEDISVALDHVRKHDPKMIAEAAVVAREIECGVLNGRVSVPAEIRVVDHDFYDFEAKYLDGSTELTVPAEIPSELSDEIQRYAKTAFEAVGAEGIARVDFFYTNDGQLLVNEINTMPGFTRTSMYPRMWKASGVEYPQLVDELLTAALTRPQTVLR